MRNNMINKNITLTKLNNAIQESEFELKQLIKMRNIPLAHMKQETILYLKRLKNGYENK